MKSWTVTLVALSALACTDPPVSDADMNTAPDMTGSLDMPPVDRKDMAPDVSPPVDMVVDMPVEPPVDMPQDQAPDVVEDMAEDVDMSNDAKMDATPDMPTPTVAGGDTCDVASDVTAGGVFTGLTTVGLMDDYSASAREDNCPNGAFSGPDATFLFQPQVDTTYRITVTPTPEASTFNPFVYVRSSCSDQVCVAGTRFSGPGDPESLTFMVSGGTQAYLIVDGQIDGGDDEGVYDLEVVLNP